MAVNANPLIGAGGFIAVATTAGFAFVADGARTGTFRALTEADISDLGTYQPTSEKGQSDGYASLDSGGKIPAAQIPSVAITEYLGDSANQTAMLALSGEKGDWTIRTDLGTVWLITGDDPTTLSDWTELGYPTAPVTSVAGKTGVVTLAASDIASGTLADARVAASNVTQHQAALSITESQISDLGSYIGSTAIASGTITALTGDLNLSGGTDGDVLTKQADGSIALETPAGGGLTSPANITASDAADDVFEIELASSHTGGAIGVTSNGGTFGDLFLADADGKVTCIGIEPFPGLIISDTRQSGNSAWPTSLAGLPVIDVGSDGQLVISSNESTNGETSLRFVGNRSGFSVDYEFARIETSYGANPTVGKMVLATLNSGSNYYEMIELQNNRLSFFGEAAVSKQSHPGTASGTDATVINAIRDALINYGLLAAS